MSIWRFFKRWRISSRKKKKYFSVTGKSLYLESNDPAAQEQRDQEKDERYQLWILLSPREQYVTALTCLKYTNPQIAARLGLSVETVRTYLRKVLNKLGLQNKADLRVLFAPWDFSEFEKRDSHG